MSFFPSSAVQVVEQTTDRLTILVPPFYTVVLILLVPALLASWIFISTIRSGTPANIRMTMAGFSLLLWGCILLIGTHKTWITLSRSNDSINIHGTLLGIPIVRKVYPLHTIRNFDSYISSGTRIGAVLKSGEEVKITSAITTQAGYSNAIDTMNLFLETTQAR